jgi:hypothetical protein
VLQNTKYPMKELTPKVIEMLRSDDTSLNNLGLALIDYTYTDYHELQTLLTPLDMIIFHVPGVDPLIVNDYTIPNDLAKAAEKYKTVLKDGKDEDNQSS